MLLKNMILEQRNIGRLWKTMQSCKKQILRRMRNISYDSKTNEQINLQSAYPNRTLCTRKSILYQLALLNVSAAIQS